MVTKRQGLALASEQLERRDLQIFDVLDGPAIAAVSRDEIVEHLRSLAEAIREVADVYATGGTGLGHGQLRAHRVRTSRAVHRFDAHEARLVRQARLGAVVSVAGRCRVAGILGDQ